MTDKKIRLTFSKDELLEVYAGLGARAGMIRDDAAIRDMRQSEYVGQVKTITNLQDRIHVAILNSETEEQSS